MTDEDITTAMKTVLAGIAPEADLDRLEPNDNLREELDLDSIDFLHFLVGLNKELGVDVPEADYGRLTTKAAIIDYLKTAAAETSQKGHSPSSVE